MRATLICVVAVLIVTPVLAQAPEDLVKDLKDPDARVRRLAAEALGKQQAESAIPALCELLGDPEFSVEDAAREALVRIGPKSVPELVRVLKAPRERHPSESDTDRVLSAPRDRRRLAAASTLYRLGPAAKEALPALTAALKDEETDVRIHAAATLGKLGAAAKPALPALFEAAKDTANLGTSVRFGLPGSVTETAVAAALAIDPNCGESLAKAALPDLIAALKGNDQAVLQAVGFALRQLGPHAKPALPALKQARVRPRGFAEEAVNSAIAAIGAQMLVDTIKDRKAPVRKRLKAIEYIVRAKLPKREIAGALIEALKDPNASIRAAAVDQIGWLGPEARPAIPVLLELLADREIRSASMIKMAPGDHPVRAALSRLGTDAVPGLAAALTDEKKTPFVRLQAAKTLAAIGRKARAALPALEQATGDEILPVAVNASCAYMLAGGDPAKAIPVLREGLRHPEPSVQVDTARAVERLGPRAAQTVPDLISLLDNDQQQVRIAATDALSRMGPAAKPAVPKLAERLGRGGRFERYRVAGALEHLGPVAREALPALIEQLERLGPNSPDPVLRALGNLGPEAKAAVPKLIELLKTKEHPDEVIDTLGAIGPEAAPAVPLLVALTEDELEFTRADAARALGRIGPRAKAAVPAMQRCLEDEAKMVRVWSAFALARITGDSKPYVARIVELWKEEVPREDSFLSGFVRSAAAEAFERLGADSRPARDLLLEAMLDEKTLVGPHDHVARALGQLHDDAEVIVPKLIALLERPSEDYFQVIRRADAAEALGLLGPKAKAAVPVLRRLRDHADDPLATAAAQALEKIETH